MPDTKRIDIPDTPLFVEAIKGGGLLIGHAHQGLALPMDATQAMMLAVALNVCASFADPQMAKANMESMTKAGVKVYVAGKEK